MIKKLIANIQSEKIYLYFLILCINEIFFITNIYNIYKLRTSHNNNVFQNKSILLNAVSDSEILQVGMEVRI